MPGKNPRRTLLTTGTVVAHCQVSYEAVNKWIKAGKLPAYTTPGGQYRIHIEDFQAFLARYGMPPYEGIPPRKRRILVVDDEPVLVQMILDFFAKTAEYECAAALDGYEAGQQVLKFDPDLVILDLVMPHLNGIEVCRKIKTTPDTRHILVLAITGHPEDRNVEKVLEVGAEACLVKPFTLETLKQQVEALFERQRRTSGTRRKPIPTRSAIS